MDKPYRQYFDAMPCYLTVQDRDFRIIEANQRFREGFGEYQGRFCYQVYKHRSEKCEVCPVEKTFRDGQSHTSQEQVRCLNGREVSVLVNTTPIRDESGEITSVMEMSTDITDIQILQKQLRASQERYRSLFEEVPCYITIQDRELNLLDTNRRFREDFGSYLGCKCYEIYKHRDEECLVCPVQQTLQDGQVHCSEEVVTSSDGTQMNVLVYTTPLHDSKGNIKYVMEMSTDITPIRELQSQLESTGLLISSVSHGIKGLLTGLDGGMYMMNTGFRQDDAKRLKKGWEMVQRNIDRIRDMVLNILYYAKERDPNWEPVSASDLTDDVCEVIERKVRDHDIELVRNSDPSAGEIECDKVAFKALLVNLAENSVDACRVDKKKSEHRIVVGARGDAEHVEFEIADNGIGMDRETREKAFSLFFSSKGAEGTGLGLFIANKIANAHGGSIELESRIERGTRFLVKMPRKRAVETEQREVA